jgi:gluconolactonase
MQSNGTIATADGALIVCDMFGHRVVEVDPATGEVLRVLLDEINGMPIDGPNDLVMDGRGGLYITDPQFTPEEQKSQPGTQVYYRAPDGTARIVVGPGEYAMPNGVEISPDGRTAYINNTWDRPGENFVWSYDVAALRLRLAALYGADARLDVRSEGVVSIATVEIVLARADGDHR